MATAKQGDRVLLHYTGRFPDGTVFETSRDREPVELVVGSEVLIGPVGEALIGMEDGETKRVEVGGAEAYGEHDPELVLTVPREGIPEGVQVGQPLRVKVEGRELVVWLKELSPGEAVVDANHPLAGQPLSFELELVAVLGPA